MHEQLAVGGDWLQENNGCGAIDRKAGREGGGALLKDGLVALGRTTSRAGDMPPATRELVVASGRKEPAASRSDANEPSQTFG